MVVVADTSPLRYLIEIGAVDVLPRLYESVFTPPETLRELELAHFPHIARAWAARPPSWLKVASPSEIRFLDRLHTGEASAISLARDCSANLVLIDDRDGTAVARDNGLQTLGTLGILREAGVREYLNFDASIEALVKTRFRCTPALLAVARQQYEVLRREFQRKRR